MKASDSVEQTRSLFIEADSLESSRVQTELRGERKRRAHVAIRISQGNIPQQAGSTVWYLKQLYCILKLNQSCPKARKIQSQDEKALLPLKIHVSIAFMNFCFLIVESSTKTQMTESS